MKRIIKNKILNIEYSEKKVFWYLVLLIVFCSGFYLYFVNGAIINVVERQKAEKEIAALSSRVNDLDSDYLTLNNKINLDYALSLGFSAVGKEKYVSRKVLSVSVSLNHFR